MSGNPASGSSRTVLVVALVGGISTICAAIVSGFLILGGSERAATLLSIGATQTAEAISDTGANNSVENTIVVTREVEITREVEVTREVEITREVEVTREISPGTGDGRLTSSSSSPISPPTTQPNATNTPAPTNTPVGMVYQIIEVVAHDSAMGFPDPTGIYIQEGDLVSISYLSGEWWIGYHSTSSCNGSGDEQTPTDGDGYIGRDGDRVRSQILCDNPDMCKPLTSAPFGSLIGSIGDNNAFFPIGNSSEFVAEYSGILYLLINYYDHNAVTGCPYGDGGAINVRVIVTPP